MAAEYIAPAGRRIGKPLQKTAVHLHGREEVGAWWRAGGWMRARQRRLLRQAEARSGVGPVAK